MKDAVPAWLVKAARGAWRSCDVFLIRSVSPFKFGRASYELNLGCNYDCKMCYLGLKRFQGLEWDNRVKILETMRDAGVVWCRNRTSRCTRREPRGLRGCVHGGGV